MFAILNVLSAVIFLSLLRCTELSISEQIYQRKFFRIVFFIIFFIWVLQPFQEYFTYIEPIAHQRWVKTREPGEKPPDHPYAELGFSTRDPSKARTTAVRNLMD